MAPCTLIKTVATRKAGVEFKLEDNKKKGNKRCYKKPQKNQVKKIESKSRSCDVLNNYRKTTRKENQITRILLVTVHGS